MTAPVPGLLGIGVQGSQHLRVAVGEPHPLDDQVFAMLPSQAIRQPQPEVLSLIRDIRPGNCKLFKIIRPVIQGH